MIAVRFTTALVLLAVCVAALLYLPNGWWALLLLPVLAMASWEWAALCGFRSAVRAAFAAFVVGSALVIGFFAGNSVASASRLSTLEFAIYSASLAFWVLVALPWLAQHRQVQSRPALAAVGWIVLIPAWLALARLQAEPGLLLALLGAVWIADTAAFLVGKAWGRHRLAPRISPAKTWEGVAGAGVAVAVYYVVLSSVAPQWRAWQGWGGALLFTGVALMSIVGDLFESWIKRQAGAKDSGTLLPGHGGVLDRVDSVTSSMPFAALVLPYIL